MLPLNLTSPHLHSLVGGANAPPSQHCPTHGFFWVWGCVMSSRQQDNAHTSEAAGQCTYVRGRAKVATQQSVVRM
jgi:hypothetical protein